MGFNVVWFVVAERNVGETERVGVERSGRKRGLFRGRVAMSIMEKKAAMVGGGISATQDSNFSALTEWGGTNAG